MFGEGDYTGVEYDHTTYRGFYDTLLAALLMETDEQIVDKYALASLEISDTRRACAAKRDYFYGRAGDDDDDDNNSGRYECTANLVVLGLMAMVDSLRLGSGLVVVSLVSSRAPPSRE